MQIPASFGEHGPGDNTITSGFSSSMSLILISLFLFTTTASLILLYIGLGCIQKNHNCLS